MQRRPARMLPAVLALAGLVLGQMAFIGSAQAKSSKCIAVPTGPGTYVVQCSTARP